MTQIRENVSLLCSKGKGILASDESTGTIGKRFDKVGLPNDEETRRAYREIFYTADVGQYISGAIMYKETLYQATSSGKPFVDCLKEKRILPGIKVDEGLSPIEGTNGETETKGLADLGDHLAKYKNQGAAFTKWRAALKLGDGCPSEKAIDINASQLADYAALSQFHGLVPIVEPELLLDGTQSISDVCDASSRILSTVIAALWKRSVVLEDCLLKPQMMNGVPSAESTADRPSVVAHETIRILQRFVPPAIPGIMFLSGGQSEAESTLNLAMINNEATQSSKAPWRLSFSFGRALQASVLKIWSDDRAANASVAQRKAEELAKINGEASEGILFEKHPSVLSEAHKLGESFRGWSQN